MADDIMMVADVQSKAEGAMVLQEEGEGEGLVEEDEGVEDTVEEEDDEHKVPFSDPVKNSIGLFLMVILLVLSAAGGLSGAGSNIPIMLIFFDMEFAEVVPISAFVAVVSTLFRFLINFNQKHPNNPERNTVNYEIVTLVMPVVFMGSLLGIMLGYKLGEQNQACLFGVTVAWSIYTSTKKAFELLAKEKKAENKEGSEEPLM